MSNLGPINGYRLNVDQRTEEVYNAPPWEQLQMAESIPTFPEPAVWVRHFNFLDFEALGFPSPIWINIVRDPVSNYIFLYNVNIQVYS